MAKQQSALNDVIEVQIEVEYTAGKPSVPVKLTFPAPPVTAVKAVVLAHGAGGDMDSGYLPYLATELAARGTACVRFTCRTLHLPTRVAAFQAVLNAARSWPQTHRVRYWFCGGHSMGGRAACQVAYDSQQPHPTPPDRPGREQPTEGEGTRQGCEAPDAATAWGRKRKRKTAADRGNKRRRGGEKAAPAAAGGGGSSGVASNPAVAATAPSHHTVADAATSSVPVGASGTVTSGQASQGPGGGKAGGAVEDGGAGGAVANHTSGGPLPADAGSSGSSGSVAGCVLLSYPLHPLDKPDQLRDQPLTELTCPVLFVRGSRDGFSRQGLFQAVLGRITSRQVHVHSVEGGDHGLVLPRRTGQRKGAHQADSSSGGSPERCEETEQEAALRQVVSAVAGFVKENAIA